MSFFLAGYFGSFAGMDSCTAYQSGDLNFDGISSHADFVAFRSSYDAENGAGAFAALVPEPSGLASLLIAALLLKLFRRHQR